MADRDYLDDLDPDDLAWLEAARRRARARLWFLATLAAATLGLLTGLARARTVRRHGRIPWQPPTA
jgi:glutathione S-transferase